MSLLAQAIEGVEGAFEALLEHDRKAESRELQTCFARLHPALYAAQFLPLVTLDSEALYTEGFAFKWEPFLLGDLPIEVLGPTSVLLEHIASDIRSQSEEMRYASQGKVLLHCQHPSLVSDDVHALHEEAVEKNHFYKTAVLTPWLWSLVKDVMEGLITGEPEALVRYAPHLTTLYRLLVCLERKTKATLVVEGWERVLCDKHIDTRHFMADYFWRGMDSLVDILTIHAMHTLRIWTREGYET